MANPPDKNPPANPGDKPGGEAGRPVSIPQAEKPKVGRPPGAATGSGKHYSKAEAAARADKGSADFDPAIIGDLFVSCAEIGDDVFCLAIVAKARAKLPPEIYAKFSEELKTVRLGERDKNMIRSGATALAKKYTFLLRWGPEFVLLVVGIQYTARMANLYRHLHALPDLPKEAPKVVTPDKPAPP